jgi:polyhydroxybutyrate depolymerase
MNKSIIYFLILFVIQFCLINCKIGKSINSELIKGELIHDGINREYILYIPKSLTIDAPLVVMLHGFTSNAEKIMGYSEMNKIAEENNFAVVYPQGTKDRQFNTFWNVGYEFHSDIEVKDSEFIVELVKNLQNNYSLSQTNTFITGMSNGGEMCYLLSCKNPEIFRAAAPVAGTMMNHFFDRCSPNNPIPILAIFGTSDKTTNYYGDTENKDGWGAYQSIPFIIDFWVNTMNLKQLESDTLPKLSEQDKSFVVSQKYVDIKDENEFLYYEVVGGGHDWPGAWGNHDINASQEIWNFFQCHLKE